jgi:hypothetical protein
MAFADYQAEIFARGQVGENPALPITFARLETYAPQALRPVGPKTAVALH